MKFTTFAICAALLVASMVASAAETWNYRSGPDWATISIKPTQHNAGAFITCRKTCTDWVRGRFAQDCVSPDLPLIQSFRLTMSLWHYWGTTSERVEVEQENGTTKIEYPARASRTAMFVPVPEEQIQIIASRLWRGYFEENVGGVPIEHDGIRFNFFSLGAGTSRNDETNEKEGSFRNAWRKLSEACSTY